MIIGRPDPNSVVSAMIWSMLVASGWPWPTMAKSKRLAIRANWSAAPARLAFNVSGSAEIPARSVAAVKFLIADSAAASLSAR